ncbi:MAG: hypothetical protein ABSC06_25045, partial [Rhodopila sp.]
MRDRGDVSLSGASVSGAGSGPAPAPVHVLDPYYVRSFFDDADDRALHVAAAAIGDIQPAFRQRLALLQARG